MRQIDGSVLVFTSDSDYRECPMHAFDNADVVLDVSDGRIEVVKDRFLVLKAVTASQET